MNAEAPVLRSKRLELHPLGHPDEASLLALFNLEPVRRYLLDGEIVDAEWVRSLVTDSRRDFASRGLGLWSARRPDAPELIGVVGFREFFEPPVEELLYALHPVAWGEGFATEMAGAALDHAFEVAGRDRVRASTDVPNEASLAVMLRLGMEEVGREPAPPQCKWDQIHCGIDRAGWASRRSRLGRSEAPR